LGNPLDHEESEDSFTCQANLVHNDSKCIGFVVFVDALSLDDIGTLKESPNPCTANQQDEHDLHTLLLWSMCHFSLIVAVVRLTEYNTAFVVDTS